MGCGAVGHPGCGALELLEHLCSGGTQTTGRPKLWGHPNHGETNHGDTQATWGPNPQKNHIMGCRDPSHGDSEVQGAPCSMGTRDMGQAKLRPWAPDRVCKGTRGCRDWGSWGRAVPWVGAGKCHQKPRSATGHRGSTVGNGDRAGRGQAAAATARAELPRGTAEPAVTLTLAPAGLLGLSQQQRLCKQQPG